MISIFRRGIYVEIYNLYIPDTSPTNSANKTNPTAIISQFRYNIGAGIKGTVALKEEGTVT